VHDISYARSRAGFVPVHLVVPASKGPFATILWYGVPLDNHEPRSLPMRHSGLADRKPFEKTRQHVTPKCAGQETNRSCQITSSTITMIPVSTVKYF
jgi:hypothetical protein